MFTVKEKENKELAVSSNEVLKLMQNLLNKDRTLCLDNYYTSVTLAEELMKQKTHLIGTLRSNRK